MRNYMYSLVAVAVLSVALFSSAGTRPALAAADLENQVAWGETSDVLSGSPNNVFIDVAVDAEVDAEADAASNKLNKTMKLRLSPGGGKHSAVAM